MDRDRIVDVLASHGAYCPGLANDIQALLHEARGAAGEAQRAVAHRAGLLRIATPATLADPRFADHLARDLRDIADRLNAVVDHFTGENV